ncbi:MAG: site-2 protease family protein [Oscillospiraceae bacterium]|nr:site-2 protease family protein [Oscillospiraceae bacterium]
MIKLRISPLIVPLAAATALLGNIQQFTLAYAVMTLHECAHLMAAMCIGLKPDTFELSPFGARLTLKNKIVRSLSDEIILYAAGPLMNGLLAIICGYFGLAWLHRMNTALMIMNLLPIIPLDGGIILKRILSNKIGKIAAERILMAVSAVLSVLFLAAALYGLYIHQINISMFIMSVFLLGNVVTGRELYDIEFITGLSGKKRTNKVRLVLIDEDHTVLDAVKAVSPAYTIIAVTDNNGEYRFLSEKQLTNNE